MTNRNPYMSEKEHDKYENGHVIRIGEFTIKFKRDFSGKGFWDAPTRSFISRGWIITKGPALAGPVACWFKNIAEARQGVACLTIAGDDADKFWALITALNLAPIIHKNAEEVAAKTRPNNSRVKQGADQIGGGVAQAARQMASLDQLLKCGLGIEAEKLTLVDDFPEGVCGLMLGDMMVAALQVEDSGFGPLVWAIGLQVLRDVASHAPDDPDLTITAAALDETQIIVDRQALLDLVRALDIGAEAQDGLPAAMDVLREPFFADEISDGKARRDFSTNTYEGS